MKTLFFTVFLVTLSLLGFSQKDPEAQTLLDKMSEKVLEHKTLKTDFVFHVTNPETDVDEQYKGSVLIKGNKYKMEVDGTVTLSDGEARWVYLEESNEVNVSDVIEADDLTADEKFMNDPLSLFTLYKDDFKYTVAGKEKIGEKVFTMVDISPEDLNKPFFKIRYWIGAQDEVKRIKYFQKDGTRIVLEFENLVFDEKAKDSDFEFNEKDYPDVEIIDLRE